MNVTIQNYRGLASASLDLSKICLLAGPNEAGKTSTVQAVAAALTGDPVPIRGVKKSDAGLLVRSGTANGNVKLTGAETVLLPAASKALAVRAWLLLPSGVESSATLNGAVVAPSTSSKGVTKMPP